ncbi:MAG: AraC family transcriptional regulator, partial [Bacteroidota bacterium]
EVMETEDPEGQFLQKVREVVLDNLDNEDFKVPDLARIMGIGRTQLHLKLKAITGESTSLYVRRIRLAEAHRLLKTGNFNVSEVAYATGFKYVQNFSRYYTKVYGKSPSVTMGKDGA